MFPGRSHQPWFCQLYYYPPKQPASLTGREEYHHMSCIHNGHARDRIANAIARFFPNRRDLSS